MVLPFSSILFLNAKHLVQNLGTPDL